MVSLLFKFGEMLNPLAEKTKLIALICHGSLADAAYSLLLLPSYCVLYIVGDYLGIHL